MRRIRAMTATQKTELLPTHTPALFEAAVRSAADLLRAGEVVALPTETVYGLAANALDEAAVRRIYCRQRSSGA
jgi:L-threonylcarbamoyladenylate synthase